MKMNPIYSAALASWKARPTSAAYISTTDTAKLIRITLKEKFPRTKFSVKSHKYSGGSSIRIHWIDGPTARLVDAYVLPFAGADFDGSIDLKYYSESWLYPNGSATFKSTDGTEGSMGRAPKADFEPGADGAIPVRFSADFVFTERSYSKAALDRVLDAYAHKWSDDLSDAIKAGSVKVVEGNGHAWIEGADNIASSARIGHTYGARSELWNMASRRMLPDAIPA